MEINRLSQEELAYELEVRGLPGGKVEEMRASLRAALRAEKDGSSLIELPYPFSFDEDKEALDKKIEEIKTLLDSFEGERGSTDHKKISTKIDWSLTRLSRAIIENEEQKKEKKRIRGQLVQLLGILQTKVDGEDSDSDSTDGTEGTNMCTPILPSGRSRVLLYKWDVRFSGEPGQSLNSFLDRVQELADARGINKEQLFLSSLDLFTGRALIWYRANKAKCHSWLDLVKELKKEFLPRDYDDRLLEEIKKRTQGKDETIGMYVAIMTNMFARLTESLTETQQLRILKRNISPFYQTQLGLTEVATVQELVELGRRLESVRASVEAFVPPPSRRSNQLLEPDLAYVATQTPNVLAISNHDISGNQTRSQRCYKCGNLGHFARFCKGGMRCFGCGKLGITRRNCENCNRSGNNQQVPSTGNRTPQNSGNAGGTRV